MLLEDLHRNWLEFTAYLEGMKTEIVKQWESETDEHKRNILWAKVQGLNELRGSIENDIAAASREASGGDATDAAA